MTIKLILFSGSYFALMLALGQLFVRNKNPANVILMVFFILNCVWLTQATWYFIGFADHFPHVNKTYVPFFCLCGPLWYLYLKCLFEKYQLRNRDLWLGLPSVICFLLSIAFYAQSAEFKNNYVEADFYNFPTVSIHLATRLAEITVIVSLIVSIRYLLALKNQAKNGFDPLALKFLTIMTTVGLCAGTMRSIGSVFSMNLFKVFFPSLIVSMSFVALYCLSHRFPELLSLGFPQPRRKAKQSCHSDQLIAYQTNIEKEKWYLDPDIKLPDLASLLNTQPHTLSELINESTGTNFNGFINRLRIEHAKEILISEPNRTILDIAYASGFNSKSAFYNYFTQQTSMTPSEFRKNRPLQNAEEV